MLFYIDYLDHVTSGTRNFNALEFRLRFDLLVFGNQELCMSVPACIKMGDTTNLLKKLDDFWKAGKIRLQLDKKHKGKPSNYFRNRKNVLAKAMSEEALVNHFEFVAYEDTRTDTFFGEYLPEQQADSKSELYIGKRKDTDALFRQDTIDLLTVHYEPICEFLDIKRSIAFTGMVNRIQDLALNKSSLFQRALIEDIITKEFKPRKMEIQAIATLLDRGFALANAGASDAIPISLLRNVLTGRWLQRLLQKSYSDLYTLICGLSWHEVYELSQNEDWITFINYINDYIFLIQEMSRRNLPIDIEKTVGKLTFSVDMYKFLCFLKDEAISAAKEKLLEAGMVLDALTLEDNFERLKQLYLGKTDPLLDIILAIDCYARRNTENLTVLVPAKRISQAIAKKKKYYYIEK